MTLPAGPLVDASGLVTKPWAEAFDLDADFVGVCPRRVSPLDAVGRRVWRYFWQTKATPPENAPLVETDGRVTPPWQAFFSA